VKPTKVATNTAAATLEPVGLKPSANAWAMGLGDRQFIFSNLVLSAASAAL